VPQRTSWFVLLRPAWLGPSVPSPCCPQASGFRGRAGPEMVRCAGNGRPLGVLVLSCGCRKRAASGSDKLCRPRPAEATGI